MYSDIKRWPLTKNYLQISKRTKLRLFFQFCDYLGKCVHGLKLNMGNVEMYTNRGPHDHVNQTRA